MKLWQQIYRDSGVMVNLQNSIHTCRIIIYEAMVVCGMMQVSGPH